MKKLIITIDGPAGAGKTTVSRILARELGYNYIDTGALYRGVAMAAMSAGLHHDDDEGLEKLCRSVNLGFIKGKKGLRLFLNQKDITDRIRTPEITMFASAVSARPVIRKFLLDLQRDLGKNKMVVFEGRDMGTVVFPRADVKFYLDASDKKRGIRRYMEIRGESSQTLDQVFDDIKRRDKNDRSRKIAPLKPAQDAIVIDSTNMSVKDVVDLMISYIKVQEDK